MTDTPKLGITKLDPGQSQKHVTVNEGFVVLDVLVQANVIDKDLTSAPGSPTEGDTYIIASGATGVWAGHDNKLAYYDGSGWLVYDPFAGLRVYVVDENLIYRYNDNWGVMPSNVAAESAHKAQMGFYILEEELTGLSGATVDSTIQIPNGAIVFNTSVRVTTTITGATSFDCGEPGNTNRFGSSLNTAVGSTNLGVIGPTAFYADTAIRLTANGGNFTAGAVRVAIHYYLPQAPQS